MNQTGRKLWSWFFNKGNPKPAALLRISFGLYTLFVLWDLYPSLHILLGPKGVFGTMAPEMLDPKGFTALLWHYNSSTEITVFYWLFFAIACCATLGLFSRFAVIMLFVCQTLLLGRNSYIAYGTDSVFVHVVFWLCFLNTGKVWSLDSWLRRRKGVWENDSNEIELWPIKCIQIQVGLIYLFAGLFKINTEVWLDGSALYFALHSFSMQTRLTPWLLQYHDLLWVLTYLFLVFELTFIVGVFTSYRYLFLVLGVIFHLGMDLFMMIRFFSLVMFCSYLAFMGPDDWRQISQYGKKLLRIKKETHPVT